MKDELTLQEQLELAKAKLVEQEKQQHNDVATVNTVDNSRPNKQKSPKKSDKQKNNNPTNHSQPFVPHAVIYRYQKMPVFKMLSFKGVLFDDAKALALLAKELRQKHPELSAEDILQNQIDLYLTVQAKAQELARNLGNKDTKTTAIEALNQLRTAKLAELSEKPLAKAIQNTYNQAINKCVFLDYHEKINLHQKEYQKLIAQVAKNHQDNTNAGWRIITSNDFQEKTAAGYTTFGLNIRLDEPEMYQRFADFTHSYPCELQFPETIYNGYKLPRNVQIKLPNSNDIDQQIEILKAIADDYHRSKGDDKMFGRKMTDGMFEENLDIAKLHDLITQNSAKYPQVCSLLQALADNLTNNGTYVPVTYELLNNILISTDQIERLFQQDEERKKTRTKHTITIDEISLVSAAHNHDDEDTESPTNDDEISSPEEENDNLENNNFNKSWSEFTDTVVKKLEGGKVTNKKCENSKFTAEIEHSKGNVSITATTDNHVSLGAKDTQGNPTVPDQKVFQALAQKALDEGSIINFGNIKTPEFKARLMIACMEKGVEIKGKPKLTDEFLNSIDPASAKRLRILQNKQNTQSQPTPTPTIQQPAQTPDPETSETTPQPVSQPKSDNEKSRDEREKSLEMHSKTRSLTPQEQHELEYIKFTKEHKQALEEAIARTGDNNNPRTAEHTKKSGYAPKNYPFFPNAREWNGWKLHLDVVPNRDEPTTKAVSEFLEKMQVDHKIANGGENGKGMTIYIGSYDDANKLAQEINSRFGKNIAEPPLYTNQKAEEIDLNKKVTGRFFLQDIYYDQYPEGAIKGLCNAEPFEELPMRRYLANLAIKDKIVNSDKFRHKIYAWKYNDFHDQYIFDLLGSYCSHKLYQKHLGEFYCGKDADKFEAQIFGGALPPKGSKDRATWDKIADLYIQKSENEYPQGIKKMAELKSKYTPIDFNKVPPLVRPQKSNTGN